MNPALLIAKYLFDKNGIINNDNTIQSFFDNGVAFPKLIEIAFNEEIPGIHKDPKSNFQRLWNNNKACQVLFSKNKEIRVRSPNFNTERERQDLLKMILILQFFKIDINSILFEVNLILLPLNIKYDDLESMMEYECLANLLKILTNDKIKFDVDSLDFPTITKILQEANVPVVINEFSLQKNRYSFFIQIEIIFDLYSSEKAKIDNAIKEDSEDISSEIEEDEEEDKSECSIENPEPSKSSESIEISKPSKSDSSVEISVPSKSGELIEISEPSKSDESIENPDDTKRDKVEFENKMRKLKALPVIKLDFNIESIDQPLAEVGKDEKNKNEEVDDLVSSVMVEFQKSMNKRRKGRKQKGEKANKLEKQKNIESRQKMLERIDRRKIDRKVRKSRYVSSEESNDYILLMILKEISLNNEYDIDGVTGIQNIDLPEFVRHFFPNKEDQEILSEICNNKNSIKKNHLIVNFLSKKSPIFRVLEFDFNNKNSERVESATFSFYIHFLNCFFLKRTKHEILDLIAKIIFYVNKKDENEEFEGVKNYNEYEKYILYQWDTYVSLYSFTFSSEDEGNPEASFENETYMDDEKYIFRWIDKDDFLGGDLRIDKNLLYYQIQFFIDAIENKNLLEKIDVSKVDKRKEKVKNDNKKKTGENEEKTLSFVYRMAFKSMHQLDETRKHIKMDKIQTADDFWDPIDNVHIFDKGTIIDRNSRSNTKLWDSVTTNYFNYVNNIKTKGALFYSLKKPTNLFRLFYYDEKEKIWMRDYETYKALKKNKNFMKGKAENKISIVVFSNSDEKDVLSMVYKFASIQNPSLDDEQICVYGFCESKIAFFNFEIKLESSNEVPLFLFLHVPEKKRKMKNIGMIIFRIYFFLSILSDVDVVILNKEYYQQQLSTIALINNVKYSYGEIDIFSIDSKTESFSSSLNSIVSSKSKNGDDSSDGDEDDDFIEKKIYKDEDDEDDDNNEEEDYVNNVSMLNRIEPRFFKRKKNCILLVNDNAIKGDITSNKKKNELFQNIDDLLNKNANHQEEKFFKDKQVLFSAQIHFINVNDENTYRDFLSNLIENVLTHNSLPEEVLNNTLYIKGSQIGKKYVDIKSNKNYVESLKKSIDLRYDMLRCFYKGKKGVIETFQNLEDEMVKYYPLIDASYRKNCAALINAKIQNVIESSNVNIEDHLKESSEKHLEYLESVIKAGSIWNKEMKDSIKKNHVNFLKKEYFDIINYFYKKNEFIPAFRNPSNRKILDDVINDDVIKLFNMFKEFKKQLNKEKNQNMVSVDVAFRRATNYSIRETENVREIKITLDSENWENEIEQDF